MLRACLFVLCLLFLPSCLLLLEEPADFPDSQSDASCRHDAAAVEDWEFEGGDDVDENE